MRYLLATGGGLFVIGLILGIPTEVMFVIGVFLLLAGFAMVGGRRRNRISFMRRAMFMGDTLHGYRETILDRDIEDRIE